MKAKKQAARYTHPSALGWSCASSLSWCLRATRRRRQKGIRVAGCRGAARGSEEELSRDATFASSPSTTAPGLNAITANASPARVSSRRSDHRRGVVLWNASAPPHSAALSCVSACCANRESGNGHALSRCGPAAARDRRPFGQSEVPRHLLNDLSSFSGLLGASAGD